MGKRALIPKSQTRPLNPVAEYPHLSTTCSGLKLATFPQSSVTRQDPSSAQGSVLIRLHPQGTYASPGANRCIHRLLGILSRLLRSHASVGSYVSILQRHSPGWRRDGSTLTYLRCEEIAIPSGNKCLVRSPRLCFRAITCPLNQVTGLVAVVVFEVFTC